MKLIIKFVCVIVGFSSVYCQSNIACSEYLKYVTDECKTTKPNDVSPHSVLIGYYDGDDASTTKWLCPGVLISDRFVLIAAHCLTKEPKSVKLADNQIVGIAEKIIHPEYHRLQFYNDIALIKLNKSIPNNCNVHPACLSTKKTELNNVIFTTWEGDVSDLHFKKLMVDFISQQQCANAYSTHNRQLPDGIVDAKQICIKFEEADLKDTCHKFAGGALQIAHENNENLYDIIGVASFGKACRSNDIPDVFTRISGYTEWIKSIVWP